MKKLLILLLFPITMFAEQWRYVTVDIDEALPWESLAGDAQYWSQYAATQDVDIAGNNLTNVGTITTTNLIIKGGSPTNGALWVATNTAGQGAWQVFPELIAYKSSLQTVSENTTTKIIDFNNVVKQTGLNFDGTNWTPGMVGTYLITAGWMTDGAAWEQDGNLRIYRNDSEMVLFGPKGSFDSGDDNPTLQVVGLVQCNSASDTFQIYIRQKWGSVTNATISYGTYFMGKRLP